MLSASDPHSSGRGLTDISLILSDLNSGTMSTSCSRATSSSSSGVMKLLSGVGNAIVKRPICTLVDASQWVVSLCAA